MTTSPEHQIAPVVFARRWKTLAVLCTSLMIVIIGNTSLNVAIPTLARDLHASTSSLQWMVDAYSLVFAGLLFTAGTLGDRYGRKGALQFGLVLFLVGTLVAATGSTATQVIVARAIMGVAAAFVMPSTLSILTNVFPAHERPKAIGIWAGIAGGGAAIGPVASGFLVQNFWWGSVFLVNVPVILFALVAGKVLIPTSKDPEEQPLDIPGALLSILGLGSLVYGIIEAPSHGWLSGQTLGTFAVSFALLAGFVARELTAEHPMLDLRLFRDRRFSVASGGMTLTFFAMFGTFFLVSQYFQLVLGYSPFKSGLLQLPMALVMMGLAPQVPKIVARFGASRVVPVGLTATAIGLAVFSQVHTDSGLAMIYASIIPLAIGMSMTMTPLTTLIMASVPLGKAGVGSAMNDTTRELGGALGVAILGSIVTSKYTSAIAPAIAGLPEGARSAANSGLAEALGVAAKAGEGGTAIAEAAKSAFVDGIGLAAIIGSVVVLGAAIAAWFLLPQGTGAAASGHAVAPDETATPDHAPTAAPVVHQVPALGPDLADESAAGELIDHGEPVVPTPFVD